MIEFDVETTGLQPWSGKHEAFMFQFFDGNESEVLIPGEDDAKIQAWLDRGADEGIRAWNTKFDRAFAEAGGFKLPPDGCWYDGMLTAHTIDERRSVALKAVSKQLFGEEAAALQKQVKAWLNAENARRRKVARDEGEEFEPANFSHVPSEIMVPYGLEDVFLTRRVCDEYDPVIEQSPDLKGTIEFERKVLDALYAVEKRGLPARSEEYRHLEQEVVENLERLEQRVMDLADQRDPIIYAKELGQEVTRDEDGTLHYKGAKPEFNPNSTPQILAALKARGADMRFMSEKKGKLSADAENLRAVDDELAAAILDFRSEFRVLSTYVRPMIGRHYDSGLNAYKEPFIAPDSRIHANYRQVGARTGRMSCSDPNMQNQPRDDLRLRYNIVADPGYKLVAVDLSNVEMVLFAAYCGEGRLLNAVRAGEDLHMLTAQMLGIRDRVRAGGIYESARQLGKTYNFSRIYGGGLRTIKRQFRCSMDEARLYKRRFDDAYPEATRLTRRIEYKLATEGYIQDKLISGRRFRVDQRDAYKGTNYLVQGTAAALLKYALIQLHADGVPVVALVHDEILAHVPENDAPEVAHLIEQRMTEFEGLKGIVPLRAEADIVDRWSDAKPLAEKDAKGNATGRKYLFTPEWAGGERRFIEEVAA